MDNFVPLSPGIVNARINGMVDTDAYDRDGFVVLRGFATAAEADRLLAAAIDLAQRHARGGVDPPTFVTPEQNLAGRPAPSPEDASSKVFRIHHLSPFREFATRDDVLEAVGALLDTTDIDCFLSQFIFKIPGAWGQPCHQDSFYFPFTPARPVVGVWVAATEAARDNGPLYVVPGSHREPVHSHIPDRRPSANLGYYEIVDHDLSTAVCVEMEPGDVLFFDSHLMHFSTDNTSTRRRAAMVYHYARAGTVDHTVERRGHSINDWIPVQRA
jgi:ectoine hydroxylase-related dioxygenase (phytanoyl-CoA dioxygenase family)